jgi:hypothetical protein
MIYIVPPDSPMPAREVPLCSLAHRPLFTVLYVPQWRNKTPANEAAAPDQLPPCDTE